MFFLVESLRYDWSRAALGSQRSNKKLNIVCFNIVFCLLFSILLFCIFKIHRLLPFNSTINPAVSCCVTHYFALLIIINQIAYKQGGQLRKIPKNCCNQHQHIKCFPSSHIIVRKFCSSGQKFTLGQYCKKFPSSKKPFL